MSARFPSYRKRKIRNKYVAIVTLSDARTKSRKDYWLGEYGSPESLEKYHRLLTQWQSQGRRLPEQERARRPGRGPTVAQVCAAYLEGAKEDVERRNRYLSPRGMKLLISMFGHTAAEDFGPNALRVLREAMISGDREQDRKPWAKSVVVRQIAHVIYIYRWSSAHEILPDELWRRLQAIEPISRFRNDVKANRKILPVPMEHVRAVQKASNRQVAALIELQLLTGARVQELLFLRICDIDRTDQVWRVRLENHKNAHRGRRRTLYFGPRAQDVLSPFMLRPSESYLFSPAEAETERRQLVHQNRKTPKSCGNRPGTNRKEYPRKKPGDHYDAASYRRCIQRACKKCSVPVWAPRQLRHNAVTEIEKQYDAVTAAILLGHSSAQITEAVYIQREDTKAVAVTAAIG